MSTITFTEIRELSVTLQEFLPEIEENIKGYAVSKNAALLHRMEIIGKVSDYQAQFSQRSEDHRLLMEAMRSEGWSDEVIRQNRQAYRAKKHLEAWAIPEAQAMLEACSVSHLTELASMVDGDQRIWIDCARFVKQHKKMPPVSAIRGYKGGFFNSKFEQRRKQFQQASEPRTYQQQRKPEPTQAKAVKAEVVTPYVYESPRPVAAAPQPSPATAAAPQVQVQQPEILSPEMTLERIVDLLQTLHVDDLVGKEEMVTRIMNPVSHKLEFLAEHANRDNLKISRHSVVPRV